ncbi:hypothetical protein E2C01_016692 [Portunus trituberculatus]|uniref:Uncharacterized protein n=1 Tax=Portunus trituberculatus TaxID=210409 RepID=A0A5B7DRG1_PORTR|nr:hypothetical protein [Portunus trituberculatus]
MHRTFTTFKALKLLQSKMNINIFNSLACASPRNVPPRALALLALPITMPLIPRSAHCLTQNLE